MSCSKPNPSLLGTAIVATLFALAVLMARTGAPHLHALQAAGLTRSGGAIAGVARFAARLTDNVRWLVATLIGLAIGVVGLLFAMGHTRAHDIAIKAAIGAGIIVGLGGIIK